VRPGPAQSAGHAYRIPKSLVKAEFDRHEELMCLMLRYTQAMISQLAQTAICVIRVCV
jgi:hypothetical protein